MKTRIIFLVLIAFAIIQGSFAQNGLTITGTVTSSADRQPIPGVNIVEKGTTYGTITDMDGKYSISLHSKNSTLIFSFVGYQTQEIKVDGQKIINVILDEDVKSLDEVVVIGYATQKRSEVTGSYSSVSAKSLEKVKTTKKDRALQGKVAGISATKSDKKADNNTTIRIRGNNSINKNSEPQYVVDGKVVNNISSIKKKDIASVEVLKDASSTAIYGSRGSNGVVIITTNKGEKMGPDGFKKIKNEEPKKEIDSDNESYAIIHENDFKSVISNPLSTFSIDVDKASYSNVRRYINNGSKPPIDAVRIEEMVNYFQYNYPEPEDDHPIAVYSEMAECPWQAKHKLLHIGLQAKRITPEKLPPSNLVFLIDVSGSMSSDNKLPLLKDAFKLLVQNLRENDRVSIVVYAGAAGVVLPSTTGENKQTMIEALNKLQAGGSTAGGAGINLAYKIAKENFIENGNNRVILATDGDFNVGASSDNDMERLIEEKRQEGIFLTCLGFGMGNYKDSKMETLADKGNGNYAYIDNLDEAKKTLVNEFGSTLFVVAKDVKLQVEFNPTLVKAYRLIGYENRLLNDEDFNNDAKDAGEMGAGHSVTALYEIIPIDIETEVANGIDKLKYQANKTKSDAKSSKEVANVKIRYKEPKKIVSVKFEVPIIDQSKKIDKCSDNFRFSASVAMFGMLLRESKFIANVNYLTVRELAGTSLGKDTDGYRKEFVDLVSRIDN